MNIQFNDKAPISAVRVRDDGYLVADARTARTGVQTYLGSEVGRPDLDTVDVWRPPEEVFSVDAMASFAHRPVTNDHPPEGVTADNWKKYAVGNTSDEIKRDGEFLRIPLMVSDGAAISDVQAGKHELSNGYKCQLDFTSGVTPEGITYDAVQRNIRGNHIAIVAAGRAGKDCRIGDDQASINWGVSPITNADEKESQMTANALQNVMVDSVPVQSTDIGVAIVTKALTDRDGQIKALQDAAKVHADAMSEKEKELAKKDAEIDGLKAKVLDGAALDKLVADRASLLADAKKLAPSLDPTGLSDSDIRKAVVIANLGDTVLAGKDENTLDVYVQSRFDGLVEAGGKSATNDQLRAALQGGKAVNDTSDVMAQRDAAFVALQYHDATGKEKAVN